MDKKGIVKLVSLMLCGCASVGVFYGCGKTPPPADDGGGAGVGSQTGGGTVVDELLDGTEIKNMAVTSAGVLSWSRLKIASKYSLTLSLSGGDVTFDINKDTGSFDLAALTGDNKLGYGKNNAKLTVYEYDEVEIDGEVIGDDVPVSTNEFIIVNTNAGISLTRLNYSDAFIKATGFYSDVKTGSEGDYLLYEQVMDSTVERVNFKVNSKISLVNGGTIKYYKSAEDRENNENALGNFDFYAEKIESGNNYYYVRVLDKNEVVKDYTLVICGIKYTNISLQYVERAIVNDSNYYGSTYTDFEGAMPFVTVLENDYLNINALYDVIGDNVLIRDNKFDIYEKDKDYFVPVNNGEDLVLYYGNADDVEGEAEEVALYKSKFDITFNTGSNGSADTWTLTYNPNKYVGTEIVVPGTIINSEVVFNTWSFYDATNVTSISLGEGITTLTEGCFKNCTSLTEILIPESITTLEPFVFGTGLSSNLKIYCASTASYINSITSSGNDFKWNYNGVMTSYTTIYDAYNNMSKTVNGVTYKPSENGNSARVTNISNSFSGSILEKIVFLGGKEYDVEILDSNCLSQNTTLTELTLPESIKTVNAGAFSGSVLTKLSVTSSDVVFSTTAFSGCTTLTNLQIPYAKRNQIINNASLKTQVKTLGFTDQFSTVNDNSFEGYSALESITLPESVTAIGANAFKDCVNLTSLQLSNNITSLGSAFISGCSKITSFVIPSGVTELENNAFENATGLTSITIPNTITSVGTYTFNGCTSLADITINANITSFADYMFNNCTSLTSFILPKQIILVSDTAFNGCSNLETLIIPADTSLNAAVSGTNLNSLKTLYAPINAISKLNFSTVDLTELHINGGTETTYNMLSKFRGVTKLFLGESVTTISNALYTSNGCKIVEFTATNNLKTIGACAFKNFTKMTTVLGINGVETIEYDAFYGCSSLANISLPSTLTHVGEEAFYACASIASINLPNSVAHIGKKAFSGVNINTLTIPSSLLVGEGAFAGVQGLTTVNFPNNLTKIYKEMFSGAKLTSITIPNTITEIEDKAFYSCGNLTSVTLKKGIQKIGAEAFYGSAISTLELPNTITTIGQKAFYNNTSLETVTLSSGLTEISDSMFAFCSKLSEITIPNGVTKIGNKAFLSAKLTSVTIPSTVTEICAYAFQQNKSLTTVNVLGNNTTISHAAFSLCSSLTNAMQLINETGYTKILASAFEGLPGVGSFVVPSSVTTIDIDAFKNSDLTQITLNEGLQTIGSRAFMNTKLSSVQIPSTVTKLGDTFNGDSVFENCTNLQTLTFAENSSLTIIGTSAFKNCAKLESVHIPKSVTTLGGSAFENCTSLNSLTFETDSALSIISSSCFKGCSELTSVVVPNTITYLNDHCFENCAKLTYFSFENLDEDTCQVDIGQNCFNGTKLEKLGLKDIGTSYFVLPETLKVVEYGGGISYISIFLMPESIESWIVNAEVTRLVAYDSGCSTILKNIYFKGTEEQWNAITSKIVNDSTNVYFYSETQPTTAGNYWHFDNDGNPVVYS